MDLVNRILEWPVIVQGALGSFLFWILFTVGQKLIRLTTSKIEADKKLGSYWGRTARDDYYKGNIDGSNYSFFICIYGSIHYFLKFVLAVFISQLIDDTIPVFAYVGYTFALYFIFRSISYVTHFSVFDSEDEKADRKHPAEEVIKTQIGKRK